MRYFDHDTSANADMKICALRRRCGGAAVDAYWTLLEMIYEAEEPLRLGGSYFTTDVIASRLLVENQTVTDWVSTLVSLGLFYVTDQFSDGSFCITSDRVETNIANYHAKCETARQNGAKGGRPKKTQSVSNKKPTGLQEKKRKEKKGVGFHKENPTPLSVSDCAGDCASDESRTPHCAACDSVAVFNPSLMAFVCPECGTLHSKDEVVFR